MKRYAFLFVSCLIVCLTAKAQMGQFFSADRFSSSLINDLRQDKFGSIWIGTDYGLNRFDGYRFQTFLHSDDDPTSLVDNVVVCMLADTNGDVWVGTSQGLDRFDSQTCSFVHYAFPDSVRPRVTSLLRLRDGRLAVGTAGYSAYVLGKDGQLRLYGSEGHYYYSRLYEDRFARVWHSSYDDAITVDDKGRITTFHSTYGIPQAFVEQEGELLVICQHGILSYSDGQLKRANIDMSLIDKHNLILWKADIDASGTIYIGTRGMGVFTVAPGKNRRLEPLDVSCIGVDMQTTKVSSTLFDHKGNLWLGCHRKGLVLVPTKPAAFQSWSFEGQGVRLGSTISSLCEGDGGMTWTTVQGVGIYGFNEKGRVVAHPEAPDAAEFIFRDKQRRYWVGTDDGLYTYDPLTGRSARRLTFDCDKFNDMTSDDAGNIYISTFARGFCVFNPQTGYLRNFSMSDKNDSVRGRLCNNWILAMMPDSHGRLWMATSSGVACYDPKGNTFKPFGWPQLLDGIMCFSLCETTRGHILIGTNRGLYVYEPGQPEAVLFPGSDVLKDKVVNYIVESNDGHLWCSTSMGIWQYDPGEETFIGHVAGNGLTTKEYIFNVGMHTDADRVFFGHNDGLTVFSPKQFVAQQKQPQDSLRLTAFRVVDQYVESPTVVNGVQVTGGKPVISCEKFTVSYLDHTVTLAFSQFNFEVAQNVSLEYRVNNDPWIRQPEGSNEISLTHLQPGTYRVEVHACQGGDCSPSKVITITVLSPWYSSTLAYFCYFLLFLALLALLIIMWHRRANRRLDEEKMKFLINATHDIRSPLTIILSALKKLKGGKPGDLSAADVQSFFSSTFQPSVEAIEHNSKRILNLVNQILDVRKIDKQQMHLHSQETDMVTFVAGVCKMFEFNAQELNIKLHFLHEGIESLPAWIDRSQFDKVITNLLSNAFKYTHEGGEVLVVLKKADESGGQQSAGSLVLQVQDTGVGLDPESLRHIFDRFYQGSNSRRLNIDGTGIGLNLCKMIVDMHHGTISAANRTDGRQGSVFTITLPLGNAHLSPEEIDTTPEQPAASQSTTAGTSASTSSSRKRVLIVDDDAEIAQYIQQELRRYYKFGICSNGKEGIKELLQGDYDLVVSDVMMPEMDGFTMLRMIKSNLNLSHLPVIMLTSKAEVSNRLEGLEYGADAFLAKPFDMEELHLTIENLIQGRRHLKGKFSGAQQQADKLEQPEVKGNDEQLMERIMKAVNKNLNDSDFNVEMLCQEVGISRAQLHRKMKELTGLSTSEFIRNIRLEQAARLLKEQKINVTQVAYTVGFSNLAHFSTIFRKHFGVSPSEYSVMKEGEE